MGFLFYPTDIIDGNFLLWPKSQRLHPFSVLMEPVSKTIVCDSSLHSPGGTFIRMMTRIIQVVFANGMPTTEENQKLGIAL